MHLLPPNIYLTPAQSLQAFDYISSMSNFSAVERVAAKYTGALAMYFVAKRAHKKYGVGPDPRRELYDAASKWASEGLAGRRFHGGDEPDLADLSVYGVTRSLAGNYETWRDLHANGDARFLAWFDAMDKLVAARRERGGVRGA